MLPLETSDLRNVIESAVAAVSVLGGAMAYESGHAAKKATSKNLAPQIVAQRINEGLSEGFFWGRPAATFCLIILLWI